MTLISVIQFKSSTTFACIVVVAIFCNAFGQDQTKADSLKILLQNGDTLSVSSKAYLIDNIAVYSIAPEDKMLYAELLLEIAQKEDLALYSIKGYRYKGVAHRLQGDLKKSLENLFQSAKIALEINDDDQLVRSYSEIATTYTSHDNFRNALIYQNKAIELFRRLDKKQSLAISLLNTGFVYYTLEELDSALLLYNEAESLFQDVGLGIGKAYTIGNRALVFWKQGSFATAEKDLTLAISMLVPLGDRFGMADYHNQLGNLYMEQGNEAKASDHLQKGLQMALELDLKEQARDASLALSGLHAAKENYDQAYQLYQQYVGFKDSIENSDQTKRMADLRTEFEVNLREKEIDTLEKQKALQQTYVFIAIILLLLTIVLLLYFRQRFRNARLMTLSERQAHDNEIKDLLTAHETKALQSMVRGKEAERKHLAKELHNHLGSLLATVKVNLNGFKHPDAERYQTVMHLVDQACQDVRNISHELNMGVSENFGLVPALKELAAHLRQTNALKVEFTASLGPLAIDSDSQIMIYRIVQELVSNVLKHAEASRLSISLTGFEDDRMINILIQDNGKGFDPKVVSRNSGGIGLQSLQEMVDGLHGELGIDSHHKGGTTVNIDLPVTTTDMAPVT